MRRMGILVLSLMVASLGQAFAQASPVDSGPMGTPMTPPQIGGWVLQPGISKAEAAQDARAQGFAHVSHLREDNYGNWIGESGRGALIIFPDGRAYPL